MKINNIIGPCKSIHIIMWENNFEKKNYTMQKNIEIDTSQLNTARFKLYNNKFN